MIEYVFPSIAALRASADHDDAVPPGTPAAAVARRALGQLRVAAVPADVPDYDREHAFGGWADMDGDGCNTRSEVLRAWSGGTAGLTGCYDEGREFVDPYTTKTVRAGRGVQIDHVVALSQAWHSGAWAWDRERRVAFANDMRNLIPTAGPVNQDKGAKGPDVWMPPARSYWCEFASVWIGAKDHYGLTATAAEVVALRGALDTCAADSLAY